MDEPIGFPSLSPSRTLRLLCDEAWLRLLEDERVYGVEASPPAKPLLTKQSAHTGMRGRPSWTIQPQPSYQLTTEISHANLD